MDGWVEFPGGFKVGVLVDGDQLLSLDGRVARGFLGGGDFTLDLGD
jgi:hypothetical protein